MYFGGIVFAGIFLIVLANRHWPFFLQGVRDYYALVASLFGDLALIVEAWTFLGPGGLVYLLGRWLEGTRP